MSSERKELYEFDNFCLDISERILWREGERMPLSEKAFDTLCVLVRHGDHLVSKDELLNEVWADAIVEENNLDKNISLLRQVLGERAGKGKFIETVRGHGYRFVADVTRVDRAPDTQIRELAESDGSDIQMPEPLANAQNPKTGNQNQKIVAFAALLLLAAVVAVVFYWRSSARLVSSPIRTIAVLPFKPIIAENRNEALEMGMADTLISKLSSREITVRPLSSVRRFAALEQDSLAAGRELGVEAVLDGSIQISNDRVRILAKLLGVDDGKQLWSGQFDEKLDDIFAVQDTISEKVAAALRIRLAGRDKKHSTDNIEAYQLYMKGRFYLLKGINPETDKSLTYFQEAIEADPNYALAYVGLSDTFRGRVVGGGRSSAEFMPKAKAAAEKAVEIDDTLAEAHAALGHIIFWYDWDWDAAEREYKRALELDPSSVDSLQNYAHLLSCTGHHAEALANIKLAREIDPLNPRVNALEGLFLLHAGKPDEAIAVLQKALELQPNHLLANAFLARAYTEKGMYAEADVKIQKARESFPDSPEINSYGAYGGAKAGKLVEARAELDDMLQMSTTQYVPPYCIALVYNGLGESEKALDYLEKALAEKDARMVFLKVEPKLNNLRSDPRFIGLMRRMNLIDK